MTAKRSAAAVGVLLVLLAVVLPIAAVLLRDPIINSDAVRERIRELLYEQTGRKIAITGFIDIDEFPWINVVVGPGEFDNPAGFPGPPLFTWQEIRLRIHYSSVYADSPLLDGVTITGLRLNLRRDASGRNNLAGIGPLVDSGPPAAPLLIPRILLRDFELRYTDESRSPQPVAELGRATLEVKEIRRGAGAIEGVHWRFGAADLRGRALFRTVAEVPPEELALRITGLDVRLPDDADASLTADSAAFGFGALRASFAALSFAPPRLAADFELAPAAIDALVASTGTAVSFRSSPTLLQLRQFKGNLQLDDDGLRIGDLDARVDRSRIRGSVALTDLSLDEPARLDLEIDAVDFETYVAAFDAGGSYDPDAPLVFPGRLLQGLPLEGRLRFGEIRARGAVLGGVTLRLETGSRSRGRAADTRAGAARKARS